jgi:hypothetical protein
MVLPDNALVRGFALLFFVVSALAHRAQGQGTFLWTWHGDHNYFQASFEVTAAEMVPGALFTSELFSNSISVSSLDGINYHLTPSGGAVGKYNPPLGLDLVLFDEATTSRLSATVVPLQVSLIDEFSNLPQGRNAETGFWIATYIPEPSATVLLPFGMLALVYKKFRANRGPLPVTRRQ